MEAGRLTKEKSMYTLKISMTTPDYAGDNSSFDTVEVLELPTKHDLNKVEKMFMKALDTLSKLTEDELKSGKKPFDKTNPQKVVFNVDIEKDGEDYGGYTHRWPNQSDAARAYLKSLLAGMLSGSGYGRIRSQLNKGA
jgi:hypothetical protein